MRRRVRAEAARTRSSSVYGYCKGTPVSGDVVLTDGGLGLTVTTAVPLTVGEPVALWLTTVVRNDTIVCYGFPTRDEQTLFTALTRVHGVGPTAALALLGALGAPGVVTAVRSHDTATLTSVPGVGPTLVRRLLNDAVIPDHLPGTDGTGTPGRAPVAGGGTGGRVEDPLVVTLVGLGFDAAEARNAVAAVDDTTTDDTERLAAALRALHGART